MSNFKKYCLDLISPIYGWIVYTAHQFHFLKEAIKQFHLRLCRKSFICMTLTKKEVRMCSQG